MQASCRARDRETRAADWYFATGDVQFDTRSSRARASRFRTSPLPPRSRTARRLQRAAPRTGDVMTSPLLRGRVSVAGQRAAAEGIRVAIDLVRVEDVRRSLATFGEAYLRR